MPGYKGGYKYQRLGTASIMQTRSVRQFDEFDSPEEVLMFAVLEQAIEDLLWAKPIESRNKNQGLQLQQDAYAWFMATEKDYLFSYISICEALDIHSVPFRRKLMVKYALMVDV